MLYRLKLVAFLVFAGLLLLAAVNIERIEKAFRDPEQAAIEFKRAKYAWQTSVGQRLPGTPDLDNLDQRLAAHGVKLGAPILMRIFKREFELELWVQRQGVFHRFAVYPICRWSGVLGPKLKQGDHQAPEGFYTVAPGQMNPNSRWHRSFNLGFPNAYDQSHGRNGTFLMVHGGCSSVGCYAMTNEVIDELWAFTTKAFAGGQKRFQVQIYPFRMTDENLARRAPGTWTQFWADLKVGHDLFEKTLVPPRVSVCSRRYVFDQGTPGSSGASEIALNCDAATKIGSSL